MEFYIPTRVYQESDAVKNHGKEIAALGRKALIVTGKSSSVKNGSLADVKAALEDNNTEYTVFDRIEENPSIAIVMEAAAIGRSEGADFVIGIGGGSPMDAAKAIALMIQNRDSSEDILYTDIELKALPVVEVPTTCGTGSEVTPYAILTRDELKTKQSIRHRIFPVIACVDAKYIKNAPMSIIVNTAIDALGHFIESYFNLNATDYSRMLCLHGMEEWGKNLHVLKGGEPGEKECNSLLFASTLAGMAISHTSTCVPHGLSYYLTYNKGVPHGKAVGYFLAGYMALVHQRLPREADRILKLLGFSDIKQFKEFIISCLGKPDINDEDAANMLNGIMENQGKLSVLPFVVTRMDMRYVITYLL